jgi:glutathione S-transferase
VDDALANTPYLAGKAFTTADINMHFALRIGLSITAQRRACPRLRRKMRRKARFAARRYKVRFSGQ